MIQDLNAIMIYYSFDFDDYIFSAMIKSYCYFFSVIKMDLFEYEHWRTIADCMQKFSCTA